MSILVYKAKRAEALSNRARAVWVVGHGYTAAMHVILVWNTGHFHSSPWLISWPSRTRWPGLHADKGNRLALASDRRHLGIARDRLVKNSRVQGAHNGGHLIHDQCEVTDSPGRPEPAHRRAED